MYDLLYTKGKKKIILYALTLIYKTLPIYLLYIHHYICFYIIHNPTPVYQPVRSLYRYTTLYNKLNKMQNVHISYSCCGAKMSLYNKFYKITMDYILRLEFRI